jgi:acetyl-CoA/propionyl-CoA carboxylase biotin carboxyl carrier protein
MLAKVIAHGRDRDEALRRLAAALDETVVLGLTTNLRFLRWLVREPAVRDGQMRIDTLARIWPPADWATRAQLPDEVWAAAARALAGGGTIDGWRLNGAPRVRLSAEGIERSVTIPGGPSPDEPITALAGGTVFVDVAGRSVEVRIAPAPDVDRAARVAAAAHHGGGPVEIVAPMPGAILAVHVSVGQTVDAADPIVTLEAMKMEHAVPALIQGRVVELGAKAGDQVARGDVLAVVEP